MGYVHAFNISVVYGVSVLFQLGCISICKLTRRSFAWAIQSYFLFHILKFYSSTIFATSCWSYTLTTVFLRKTERNRAYWAGWSVLRLPPGEFPFVWCGISSTRAIPPLPICFSLASYTKLELHIDIKHRK